jgi:proliferating cell nuclear antigen
VNGDIGNGNITLCKNNENDDDCIRSISVRNIVKHDFALRHLSLFTKATTLSDEVIISMTKDMPIVLRYNIKDNGEAHHGHLSYFLAPKINDINE